MEKQNLLGVVIDNKRTWNEQIDTVCLTITRRITLLKLLSKYIDKRSMTQYYNSYILPIFDYGCMIWGCCTTANTQRLLKLQKRAARIILKADILVPSQRMFSELRWLSFPRRVQYHTCVMVYKALNNLAPECINDLFQITTTETHVQLTMNCYEYQFSKHPYMKIHSQYRLPDYGTVPLDIRMSSSLETFKRSVKTHLLAC